MKLNQLVPKVIAAASEAALETAVAEWVATLTEQEHVKTLFAVDGGIYVVFIWYTN